MKDPRLIAAATLLIGAACGGKNTEPTPPPPPPTPTLVRADFPGSVAVGGTLSATVVVSPTTALAWSSEAPAVASVSNTGAITGIQPGAAVIRATAGALSVTGTVAVFGAFVELAAGGRHACARTASLEVWCWGRDDAGELGQLSHVETCQTSGGTFACSTAPRRNLAALAFTQISAGEFRTCGLTAAGEGYCWGVSSPALGPPTGTCGGGPCNPQPVKVSGSVHFSWIGAGDDFACGLTAIGDVYCMGLNDYGQLGSATSDQCGGSACSLAPVQVSPGISFQSLTVHGFHACALTLAGVAYCWGWNAWGQLGNGVISGPLGGSSIPVPVSGGLRFVTISAGKEHTCALEANGKAWCWGGNEGGQIGDGSPPSGPDATFSVPRAVSGNFAFASIAEGLQHTCAVTTTGEAWCWGANQDGQLGDGTTDIRLTPTRVLLNLPLSGIVAGRNSSCGLAASGQALCWGTNLYGRLGIGTETPSAVTKPVGVGGAPVP
jgi:alpha-tubulin suppressor-like RCC1 family protein